MSVSTEVQRTLVKSPPELWTELSNPDALARHFGELGEIRITQVEPETKVEWESDGATGIVQLKPSGWGTKVTLSVTRNPPADEPPKPEPVVAIEPEPAVETEAEPVVETEPEPTPEPELKPVALTEQGAPPLAMEPEPVSEPMEEPRPVPIVEQDAEGEPETVIPVEPEPEQQPGFFARLFRRRRARQAKGIKPTSETTSTAETEPVLAVEPEVEVEVVALAVPEPIYPDPHVELATDLASELESVEAQMTEETTELLTGVLDRLGAAHHRPFSRG